MTRPGRRWPLALAVAVVVAEVAVLVMRPRQGVIAPAPVSARSYFSPAELERARNFRRPQLALYGGQLVLEAGLLVLVARRPPRALRRASRAMPAAAAAGAALSIALTVVTLPVGALARQRAIDVGLVTQSWGGWGVDLAKSTVIGALIAAGAAVGLLALVRRFPRAWPAPAALAVVALGVVFVYTGPVVLDPIFNRFTPLSARQARADVLELARRAGVSVGQVYEVDASRRTSAANAYVTGLGPTKRVVLYDTLLRNFSRDELRLVVAHELGHVRDRDVPLGLLYLAIVTPGALLAARELSSRLRPPDVGPDSPAALGALALALALVAAGLGTVSNQLSRAIEARADAFSLRLTDAPDAFIAFERGIALRNVADPDPPGWVTALLATHPPTIERIGTALAFERAAARRGQASPASATLPPRGQGVRR